VLAGITEDPPRVWHANEDRSALYGRLGVTRTTRSPLPLLVVR
jgi:hypothetical protein